MAKSMLMVWNLMIPLSKLPRTGKVMEFIKFQRGIIFSLGTTGTKAMQQVLGTEICACCKHKSQGKIYMFPIYKAYLAVMPVQE